MVDTTDAVGDAGTPFASHVFRRLAHGHHTLTWRDFLIDIWDLCTMDKRSQLNLAFRVFDVNDDHVLDHDDIINMLEAIYFHPSSGGGHHNVTASRKTNEERAFHAVAQVGPRLKKRRKPGQPPPQMRMTRTLFEQFARKHSHLLAPVHRLQYHVGWRNTDALVGRAGQRLTVSCLVLS